MVLPPPPLHHPSNGMDVYESEQQNNDMRFFGTPLTLPTRNTIKDTEFIAAVAGANTVQLRQRRTSNATPSTAFGVSTKTSLASESNNKSASNQPSPLRGEDVTTNAPDNNSTSSYSQKLSIDKSSRDPSPIMIPPHVTRSLEKSRGTSSNDSITSTRSASVIDASFTSDSYSLLSSMQFISRDLEEEERANKSKSDRERAFLYKKRYMDVYGLAIGLTRRVTELEKGRLKRLEEIRLLKQALERNDGGSEDEKLQTLCRQVNQLARELSEPEEIVRSSREEEEIKSLRARVERLESEKEQAWNEVKRLNENKVLMEKERQELQASLHRTEQELEAVHTLWLKEKSDWNETVDQYKKQMSCDAETWKREVGRWKEHEMDMRQQLEQANRCIGVLQTQVDNRTEIDRMHQELVEAAVENQTMRQELSTRTQALDKAKDRLITLEQAVYQVEGVRRRLHNQVMELKGNIRVFCRVRPMLSHEQKMDTSSTEIFQYPDYHCDRRQIELLAHPKSHVGYGSTNLKKYAFDFDLVFNGYCTQTHIFDEVSTLIQSALDGFNVSIFAYGQTGSGKTYTMMHGMIQEEEKEMGIVGRALELLFNRIEDLDASGWSFTVSLEMIEIYNESLRDLLASTESMDKVDLRLDSQGKPTVINTCSHVIQNPGEAYTLLEKALTRRATKSTQMNDRSSRSHCVISIRLVGVNELMKEERKSVVHLIDLAGSERLSKSGSGQDKEKLKEAQCINKSLSALGNVIAAIGKKSSHVPFRDSKLTHFLRPSLGGDAKTLMICTLSPLSQHREETLNSLRFAKTVNSCEITYPSYYEQSTKSS